MQKLVITYTPTSRAAVGSESSRLGGGSSSSSGGSSPPPPPPPLRSGSMLQTNQQPSNPSKRAASRAS
eukprot:4376338-Prymnesium_polylepis.1